MPITVRCTSCDTVYDTISQFNFDDDCPDGEPIAVEDTGP